MLRILLVDDEPLVLIGLQGMLEWEKLGYTICGTARNGRQALELIEREKPDIVVADVKMPLMDGLTAASNIRHLSNADAKTIPIIAMTANAFDDDIDKSKAAGMNAHLAKPIDPGRLYQTLYDFICKREEEENEQVQGVL